MSTGKHKVLIIGQRPDPHIDDVAERLSGLGSEVLVLDRYRSDQGISLTAGFGGEAVRLAHLPSGFHRLDDVDAVWWRVKANRPADFGFFEATVDNAFATREWSEVLRSLNAMMIRSTWVNPVPEHVRAGRKPAQLALAETVGLRVPRTVITNSSSAVLEHFPPDVPLVYKTLTSFIQPPDQIVFTSEVTRELVNESEEQIAVAPGIFQERIEKSHELRITVVGSGTFVVRIESQDTPSTALDWRRDQGRQMYEVGALTPTTRAKLLAFQDLAGLKFATYDVIVTPSGDEVFLECNPGGQWLWLDHELSLGISQSLAELLHGV